MQTIIILTLFILQESEKFTISNFFRDIWCNRTAVLWTYSQIILNRFTSHGLNAAVSFAIGHRAL